MMKSILKNVFLFFVCAFLSAACSKDGDNKGTKQTPNGTQTGSENPSPPNSPTNPDLHTGAGDLATLPMTKWCASGDQEGTKVQHRFYFQSNQNAEYTIFALNPDDSRGSVLGQVTGTWQVINQNDLQLKFNGQTETFKIYVSKSDESPTGAPQLLLGDASEMSPFDPCE